MKLTEREIEQAKNDAANPTGQPSPVMSVSGRSVSPLPTLELPERTFLLLAKEAAACHVSEIVLATALLNRWKQKASEERVKRLERNLFGAEVGPLTHDVDLSPKTLDLVSREAAVLSIPEPDLARRAALLVGALLQEEIQ